MDKVQKIREEVERLMYGFNLEADIASCEDTEIEKLANIKYQLCKKILDYIDKVQKEPVSEDLEAAAEEWDESLYRSDAFKAGAKWQKEKDESKTEDLGDYINELSKQFPEVSFAKLSRIAVRVAKWKEEQMIAKAIDAEVLENYDGKVIKYDDTILDEKLSGCKVFDKVKVIIIKED